MGMQLSTALKNFEDLDQEKCWSFIMNESVQIGKYYRNPTRSDKQPGCKFHWKAGRLWLKDWKDGSNIDCVKAWSIINNLSYRQAICALYRVTSTNIANFPNSIKIVQPQVEQSCQVYVEARDWEDRDREYWSKRKVTKKQLNNPNHFVVPVYKYTFDFGSYKKTSYPKDLCYGYYGGKDKWKLYFPDRKKPRFKGNLGVNDIWYVQRDSSTLLITKSHKDLLVWENLVDYDLAHVQAESNYPTDYMSFWDKKYEQIMVVLDNDEVGLEKGASLAAMFKNGKHLFIDPSLGVKDLDEFIVANGLKATREYLQTFFQ